MKLATLFFLLTTAAVAAEPGEENVPPALGTKLSVGDSGRNAPEQDGNQPDAGAVPNLDQQPRLTLGRARVYPWRDEAYFDTDEYRQKSFWDRGTERTLGQVDEYSWQWLYRLDRTEELWLGDTYWDLESTAEAHGDFMDAFWTKYFRRGFEAAFRETEFVRRLQEWWNSHRFLPEIDIYYRQELGSLDDPSDVMTHEELRLQLSYELAWNVDGGVRLDGRPEIFFSFGRGMTEAEFSWYPFSDLAEATFEGRYGGLRFRYYYNGEDQGKWIASIKPPKTLDYTTGNGAIIRGGLKFGYDPNVPDASLRGLLTGRKRSGWGAQVFVNISF